jgi:hypothetical protein
MERVFCFYRGKIDQKIRVAEHRLATQDDARRFAKEWRDFRLSEAERKKFLSINPDDIHGEVEDQELEVKVRKRPVL